MTAAFVQRCGSVALEITLEVVGGLDSTESRCLVARRASRSTTGCHVRRCSRPVSTSLDGLELETDSWRSEVHWEEAALATWKLGPS